MALDFIAGAGAGAQDALAALLERQLREQLTRQQMAEAQQRLELERQRIKGDEADREARRKDAEDDRQYRQGQVTRQRAMDTLETQPPGPVSEEAASSVRAYPPLSGRITERRVLQGVRPVGGAPEPDTSGPQNFPVLEPTEEQAERAFARSRKAQAQDIVRGLGPRQQQAQVLSDAGVHPSIVSDLLRDPAAELKEHEAKQEISARIGAKYRPETVRPKIDVRNIPSRGPNGEPGNKIVVFQDGVPTYERWEPGNPSATERQSMGDFQTLSDALDSVRLAYKPELVGPAMGRYGAATQAIPGLSVPKGFADLASKLAQVQNSLIYLKSGKQINEQEFARLQRELPLVTDKPDVFLTKLENAETLMQAMASNRRSTAGVPEVGTSMGATTADPVLDELERRRKQRGGG